MSFGFSAGDFVAAAKLIADIVSCLDDASGSAGEYQEVLRELRALDNGLKTLNSLRPPSGSDEAAGLDAIKCSALACQVPLQNFLDKTRKYHPTLRLDAKEASAIAVAGRKIDWRLRMHKEAEKLRMCLSLHVGTINMQLSNRGLAAVFDMSQEVCEMHAELAGMLQQNAQAVAAILEGVNTQRSLLQRGNWLLSGIASTIVVWLPSKIDEIVGAVTAICTTTQKIYELVLEIRGTSGSQITSSVGWIEHSLIITSNNGQNAAFPRDWGWKGLSFILGQQPVHAESGVSTSALSPGGVQDEWQVTCLCFPLELMPPHKVRGPVQSRGRCLNLHYNLLEGYVMCFLVGADPSPEGFRRFSESLWTNLSNRLPAVVAVCLKYGEAVFDIDQCSTSFDDFLRTYSRPPSLR